MWEEYINALSKEEEKAKVFKERATTVANLAIQLETARRNRASKLKEEKTKVKEIKDKREKKARARERAIKALAGLVEWQVTPGATVP